MLWIDCLQLALTDGNDYMNQLKTLKSAVCMLGYSIQF